MKKYIKYIIIIVIIVLVIIGINYLLRPSMDKQIKDYLINMGYTKSEDENLYIKNTNNETKSFSLGDYTFMIEKNDIVNEMETSLNATYDYKKENIIYSYRVNYGNSVNVFFKGEYDGKNFTCNKEFSSTELSDNSKNSICNLASTSIKLFELEAKTLFSKYKFVDYIKNK